MRGEQAAGLPDVAFVGAEKFSEFYITFTLQDSYTLTSSCGLNVLNRLRNAHTQFNA